MALCLLSSLGSWAIESKGSVALAFRCWAYSHAAMLSFLMWDLGTDIRSSYLCDKHCIHPLISSSSLVSLCSPAGPILKPSRLSMAVIIGVHHHACLKETYLTNSVQMQRPRLEIPGLHVLGEGLSLYHNRTHRTVGWHMQGSEGRWEPRGIRNHAGWYPH